MSEPKHYVVAHDPRHPEAVGAIVSEPAQLAKSRRAGAVLMPIDPALEHELAMGGFVKRNFGPDGVVFNANRGENGCPIALQVRTDRPFIHWAAGIVQRGPNPQGQLRIWSNTGSAQVLSAGLAVIASPAQFAKDDMPSIITGRCRMTGLTDGFLGLGLWGVATGVGVLWLAVTQAHHEE
jgi:hypothetical protein